MMPGNAKLRHIEIEKRNLELAEAANTMAINKVEMNDTKLVLSQVEFRINM